MSDIFEGDGGVEFLAEVHDENDAAKDISSAVTTNFLFQKPDGSVLTVDASFKTDGTDGKLSYTTTNNDLDQIGLWRWQAYIEFGDGTHKYTSIDRFKVKDAIPIGS